MQKYQVRSLVGKLFYLLMQPGAGIAGLLADQRSAGARLNGPAKKHANGGRLFLAVPESMHIPTIVTQHRRFSTTTFGLSAIRNRMVVSESHRAPPHTLATTRFATIFQSSSARHFPLPPTPQAHSRTPLALERRNAKSCWEIESNEQRGVSGCFRTVVTRFREGAPASL